LPFIGSNGVALSLLLLLLLLLLQIASHD